MTQQLTLLDGRNLDFQVSGDPHGFPLIFVHGTPGAGSPPDPALERMCKSKNVKLITYSRAGYGGSSRNKGRRVVDDLSDIQALKNHLGVNKCAVGGWSGGGPYALLCAARLPGCVAALCIAGGAPFDAEGLDFMAGQGEDNVEEFKAAMQGESALQTFIEAQRKDLLAADAVSVVEALNSLLPEVDKRALLSNKEVGQQTADSFHEGLKISGDGWIDDDFAQLVHPWGFELGEINVPVFLYQGSEDLMVPFAHGKWLAEHIPKEVLRAHLQDGEGHISIFFPNLERMIQDLLDVAGVSQK